MFLVDLIFGIATAAESDIPSKQGSQKKGSKFIEEERWNPNQEEIVKMKRLVPTARSREIHRNQKAGKTRPTNCLIRTYPNSPIGPFDFLIKFSG